MAAQKQAIDIETLVQWVVHEESLKWPARYVERLWNMFADSTAPPLKEMQEYAARRAAPRMLHVPPHQDSITIGDALCKFDFAYGLSESEVRQILGGRAALDHGVGNAPTPCVTAGLAIRPNLGGLIVRHALMRGAPIVDQRSPRPEREKGCNRHPVVFCADIDGKLYEAPSVKNRRGGPSDFAGEPRCRLFWVDPTPVETAEQRIEYTLWWRALVLLADKLNELPDRLQCYAPDRPNRPAAPRPLQMTLDGYAIF